MRLSALCSFGEEEAMKEGMENQNKMSGGGPVKQRATPLIKGPSQADQVIRPPSPTSHSQQRPGGGGRKR